MPNIFDYLQLVESQRLNPTVFVDCDGVLANFNAHVESLFGRHPDKFSEQELWDNINGHFEFFLNVPMMPDARQLWQAVKPYHPIVLTGCPKGNFEIAAKQKRIWIARHFGANTPVITCLSRDKQNHLKHSGDILIDDRSGNIKKWVRAGGVGILHHDAATTIKTLHKIMTPETVDETKHAPTIADASKKDGIDRKISDRIIDPKGYFHPKWPTNGKKPHK